MRKPTYIFLLMVFVCSAAVFAAEFKLYPGAKIDERATNREQEDQDLLNMVSSRRTGLVDRINIYATSDSFDKVCAFYKGIGKEVPIKSTPIGRGEVTKTKSGLTVKETDFILDGAAEMARSKLRVRIQRPYLGEMKEDSPGNAKYLDQIYDYIRDATAIIVTETIEVRTRKQ